MLPTRAGAHFGKTHTVAVATSLRGSRPNHCPSRGIHFSHFLTMANYTASALLAAQTKLTGKFNEAELRRKRNPALEMAMKNMAITLPGHQEVRKKDTRPVKAYYKTKRASGSATAKSHNHTGGKADSAEITLAWVNFTELFSIHLKQGQSNIFSYQEQLAHEIMESAQNLHGRAGTAALAYLQAYRNQLASVDTANTGTWNATNFSLEIDAVNAKHFLQYGASFMRQQDHRPQFDLLADVQQYTVLQQVLNQGAGNNTNLAWQSQDYAFIGETNETIDPNYTNGSALIMPTGTFAAMPWNDPVNLKGKGDMDSVLGGYTTLVDPLGTGLLFDVHGYTERADGSSLGGSTQDEVLQVSITLSLGWALPPLSTANDSVVWQLAQMQ